MISQTRALSILGAITITATLAVAADPNPPTVISPTSITGATYPLINGIAPNGIAANPGGIFFTQPFTDGLQPRGVYTITTAGVVGLTSPIPSPNNVSAENGIAIVPLNPGSGFTTGDIYSTGVSVANNANDAIYKNGVLFKDGITASVSKHQTALAFDTVGSFAGALIVTADTTITLYNSAGTVLKTFTGPSGMVLQVSTVAPLTYAACPGCLFVTAMPAGNIDNANPSGSGEILTVSPSAVSGTAAVLFATTTGIPEPESIQFVTANSLSCTVGGFSYFASGYATDSQINKTSTDGAVLAWAPAQLTPYVGHYLVQNEEFSGAVHGAIYVDAGLTTQTVFSDSTTATNAVGYQLEDTAIIQCPSGGTGCPATQGFWHKKANWPNVTTTVDGVIYNGATDHSMVIGGIMYTQAQLLSLMPTGALHPGAFTNTLSQFIAAVLNVAAGAQVTPAANAAITGVNAALSGVQIFSGSMINPAILPSTITLVESYLTALDNYNSAVGLGCTEGSGLNTGSGKN